MGLPRSHRPRLHKLIVSVIAPLHGHALVLHSPELLYLLRSFYLDPYLGPPPSFVAPISVSGLPEFISCNNSEGAD